jgi:hypothetical protein
MKTHVIVPRTPSPDNPAVAEEVKIRQNQNFTSPGATAVFSYVPEFFHAIADLFRAVNNCHPREFCKNLLKIFTIPLGTVASIERITSLFSFIITGASLAALSLKATVCGLIFLGAELIFESFRLRDVQKFKSEILNETNAEAVITKMQAEFSDEIQLEKLKRIVGNRGLIAFNKHTTEHIQKRSHTEVVQLLTEQADKTRKVHIVGIAAISIAIITLALGFTVCPPLLLLSVTLIGTVIEYGRYFAPAAYIEHEGTNWRWSACLPNWIQNRCLPKAWTRMHPA